MNQRSRRTLVVAFAVACIAEIILGIVAKVFGNFGPTGPANGIAQVFIAFHFPGSWLSHQILPNRYLPEYGSTLPHWGIMIGIALLIWTCLAYAAIRRIQEEEKTKLENGS